MRLPYWLLKLLPMWDYICPKCRKEVKKNSHKCLYCREHYITPIRVPPRTLKDKKALEEYVHKHVFPRVSQSRRNYLTKFFTIIFQDDFETGNFALWDGGPTDAGCTATVGAAGRHCGSNGASFHCDGSAVNQEAWKYKNITARTEIYVRGYHKFDALTPTTNKMWLDSPNIRNQLASGFAVAYAFVRNVGGIVYWGVYYINGAGSTTATTSVTVQANVWYCVELYAKVDAVNGVVTLWIDGVQAKSVTGLDTSQKGTIQVVEMGERWTDEGFEHTIFLDCVVFADIYIGPQRPPYLATVIKHI